MVEVDQAAARERQRLLAEYARRDASGDAELYAPWQPAEAFMVEERRRVAATMLHRAGVFPSPGEPCLEVGFGRLGWLADLLGWGVREADLHGIELDPQRAAIAQDAFPGADLRVGDATCLPWADGSFRLVVASTVFTSILDDDVRRSVAFEIVRVLVPEGALLWYDFAWNNPRNPNVRKVSRRELLQLFPTLSGEVRRVTLAPPITRLVAPHSWLLAQALGAVPLLRTHLLGVLVKRG